MIKINNKMLASSFFSALLVISATHAEGNPDASLLRLLAEVELSEAQADPVEVPAAEPAVMDEVAVEDPVPVADENPAPVIDEVAVVEEASDAPDVLAVMHLMDESTNEPVALEPESEALPVVEELAVDDVVVAPEMADEEVDAVVENDEPLVEEESPLDRVLKTVQVADAQAEDSNALMDDTVVVSDAALEESIVDDLGMESYDNVGTATVDNLISVRLNKVGLEEAINLFAQLSGANIIVPELSEAAQISVNLKDVEWRPALQSILDTYNYELYQRVSGSNVFSVRRRPAGAPVPQVVETFKLDYATVPNAAALIKQLLPADAKVSEFASRNMIVVKSTESSLSEVRAVLDQIDTVRQQVYIESKFMELTDGAQKDLGINWQVLQGYQVSAKSLSSSFDHTDSDETTKSRDYLMDGTQTEAASVPEFVLNPDTGLSERYQEVNPSVTKVATDLMSQVSTAVLDADDFSLILSALEQDSGAAIVSNPKIIVANEERANISIVTKEPNLKQNRQQAMNNTEDTITYEMDTVMPFFEYGISLEVTPSINTSSNITIQIKPSLTRKVRDKRDSSAESAGNELLSYPVISEKSIDTVFSLTSGQTAAIGGLTEVTENEVKKSVPVLGKIPLLGRLFSWEQIVNSQDETIIFVTVGLANTQELDAEKGLPEDSELARRRVIVENRTRSTRAQDREYFQAREIDRLEDELKALKMKEERRTELRMRAKLEEKQRAERKALKNGNTLSLN